MRAMLGLLVIGLTSALLLCAHASAQWHVPPVASMKVPTAGVLDLSCTELTVEGELDLSGGSLALDANATFASSASVTGNGLISVGGDLVTNGSLDLDAVSVVLRDGCNAANSSRVAGSLRLRDLTLSSNTGRTFVIPEGINITVLGMLTIQGTAALPVRLLPSGGTAVIALGPSATLVRTFASVPPTVLIEAGAPPGAAPIPTLSQWGLIGISAVLMVMGLGWMRRKGQPTCIGFLLR